MKSQKTLALRGIDFLMGFYFPFSPVYESVFCDVESGGITRLSNERERFIKNDDGSVYGKGPVDMLIEEGYDLWLNPYGKTSSMIFDIHFPKYREDFLYVGEPYVQRDGNGDLRIKPILDRIPSIERKDTDEIKERLKGGSMEDYVVALKGRYIVEKPRLRSSSKMELTIHELNDSAVRYLSDLRDSKAHNSSKLENSL